MPQPQITANMETEKQVLDARMLALKAGKSLREWAGEKLTAAIVSDTKKPKHKKP